MSSVYVLDMPLPLQAAELVLAHAASSLQWVGYLSSTSVYGDWGGSWVDERSECIFCVLCCGSLAHMVHGAGPAKLTSLIVCVDLMAFAHCDSLHAEWRVAHQAVEVLCL